MIKIHCAQFWLNCYRFPPLKLQFGMPHFWKPRRDMVLRPKTLTHSWLSSRSRRWKRRMCSESFWRQGKWYSKFMENLGCVDDELDYWWWGIYLCLYIIDDYIWLYMIIYDYIWLYMIIYDYIWLYNMIIYDYIWLYMIIYDYIWLYMIIYDYIWLYMCMCICIV